MSDRVEQKLAHLDQETDRLLRTCRGLAAADAHRDTLCEGWDAAHLLSHVARNAEALSNLVLWAQDGVEREAYTSPEQREADIEAGAALPWDRIVEDVEVTAARFRELAQSLTGPAGDAEVRTRTGNVVRGHQVISMRINEVVLHHVDLAAGHDVDDSDPGWLGRTLRQGAQRWDALPDAPSLTLVPEGLDPVPIGGGGPVVAGTPGELLLWLARGRDTGLRTEVELPTPPPWA
ncbi:maleylpyruvate isomerase family mycothiol-dependent enzyme [Ornithinimicrobium flavum]|uniref:maleylpyruvate isomerase family mycothiol-dependent enzyme n=1 Tax=Ornithinimicrobium flavum TaxID=1288636 RepID=UPI00106FCE12|nr:maleylpyruvate isomerase family mycothiol-dependent enzyme [Ornithinimicrobium flavum]